MTHIPSPQRHGGLSSGGLPPGGMPYNRVEHNIFMKMQMADPLKNQTASRDPAIRTPATEKEPEQELSERIDGGAGTETEKTRLEDLEAATHLSSIMYGKMKNTERN